MSSQNWRERAASRSENSPFGALPAPLRPGMPISSGSSTRCATPIQMNTARQPICTITAARIAIMTSCPTLMPETATALARPARPG